MYNNRGQIMPQQQHPSMQQMPKEQVYIKDEMMKDNQKIHESNPKTKATDETIKNLCNIITSMYFEAEQRHRMMMLYTRIFMTENGKSRLDEYFYECYEEIGIDIASGIAKHMKYKVNYFREPEAMKEYDFNSVEGHKEYWNDLLNNEEYMYKEMQEYAKLLHEAGYYPFHNKITEIMEIHRDNKMRIEYVICYLKQYDYSNWILEKSNKIIHDHLEEHKNLDFSL